MKTGLAIQSGEVQVLDLTRPIFEGMSVPRVYTPTMIWPNEVHDERSRFRGMTWASFTMMFSDHGPTHVDALSHIDSTGTPIDEVPIERFASPGVCIRLPSTKEGVSLADLQSALAPAGGSIAGLFVLICSAPGRDPAATPSGNHTWLTLEAATWLAERGVNGVGVESSSIDPPGSDAAHVALLERGAMVVENLQDLERVGAREVTFVCFPLRIRDGTAAPARALALLADGGALGRDVASGAVQVSDLSQPIYAGMPGWEAIDVSTRIWRTPSPRPSNAVLMGDHSGTHVDAISHYDPDGPPIDQSPIDHFISPAVCLDLRFVAPVECVGIEELARATDALGADIPADGTVLLWTGHHDTNYGTQAYMAGPYTGLTRAATEWFADRGVRNIGIDSPSTDMSTTTDAPSHRVAMERGFYITEHLANLRAVANRRFTYLGVPLPIRGASASPVRAAAVLDDLET